MRQIAVIGSSSANEDEYQFAYEIGKALAKMGIVVVNGGRGGVMEAVSKGVHEAGGISVGILPEYDEIGNEFLKIRIRTGMLWARNVIVVASGDMIIAIGGAWGTLSEIAYANVLGKFIIGYKTHEVEGLVKVHSVDEAVKHIKRFYRMD